MQRKIAFVLLDLPFVTTVTKATTEYCIEHRID